ncbi:hypothetical protein H0E87_019858 [Populus deltoides]|uniref:Exocyst complex component Sec8 n=1 Tax=Populus deltoides TaxID=3696 RepID=A0A8T2XWW7_POPDE|nr:hypothetical protein H0E87_019858 [Populus deltoides]
MGIFDGLPVPPDKAEQSDVVEDVVDEVVQSYHSGFNKAIQNYSQILRLFSESAESIASLKVDLAEAKKRLGTRNKQLHQLWYRSVTLRHIISLLDQIEGIAKVPARIEKLIAEKQFYAAVQLHAHSSLMLEREGLQMVGALQDVRSELTKLRGVVFYKILEDLHAHLYNKGEYSSVASSMYERDDELPTTIAVFTMSNSQSLSRRTRLMKGDNHSFADGSYKPSSIDGGSSFDGHDEDLDITDEATSDGHTASMRTNGGDGNMKDIKIGSRQIPSWLSNSTPDEFIETIKKSDAPLHVKYLQTMVECLCMLGKVAAAGAIICQRLRPTIHDIITSKIKSHSELVNSSRSSINQSAQTRGLHFVKGQLESYKLPKQKRQNGTLLAVSPVSPVMAPTGKAQAAAKELLDSILDTVIRIFENHVVVGELLEFKTSQNVDLNTPGSLTTDLNWNLDSEASQVIGGYSIGFSLTVLQSECQQLICEILRATPEAASADASVQTARLASKAPSKGKKWGWVRRWAHLCFLVSRMLQYPFLTKVAGVDLIRQGWSRKGPNVLQEGYGSAAVLPELGIYLAASVYRPVLQISLLQCCQKIIPSLGKLEKHSASCWHMQSKVPLYGLHDAHLSVDIDPIQDSLPSPTTISTYLRSSGSGIAPCLGTNLPLNNEMVLRPSFDSNNQHRKSSDVPKSPAAFRPRAHTVAPYTPSIEKGRPVLQGLLAIDFLAKEVLGWAQAMPKFAGDLAVLEKQSYMLIGRHDIEKLMRFDPASTYLPNSLGQSSMVNNASGAESIEIELELSEILLNLRPIKQENLIRDDNKLILLASLSDSLELGQITSRSSNQVADKAKTLAAFADDYRKLAIDCLKVLHVEMKLETIFHMQEMTNREYLEDQDAEEPDDFVIALTAQITRRDEEIAPFVAAVKQNYIFGGICSIAANASIKALADMKSINLFGVQQICRNSIALEQALAAIPSIDSEAVQQRLDHVRTYYELLNMPFEALLAFITEHENLFTPAEYANLLKVNVLGREIPPDAQDRVSYILSH